MSERDGIERAARVAEADASDYLEQARMLERNGDHRQADKFSEAYGVAERIARNIHALPPAEAEEPTAEMVEAGARAIYEVSSEPEHGDSFDSLSEGWKQNLGHHATQAYLAMRAARPAGGREGGA